MVSFFPSSALLSQITTGNSTYAGMASKATANSLTWPHTVTGNSNGILIVTISVRTDVAVSSVKFGSWSLTPAGSQVDGTSKVRIEMWYLKAPEAGTANIIVTLAGSANFVAGATNFFGIDQTTPYSIVVKGQGTGDPSLTVVSAAGELVIDGISDRDVDSELIGSGQSILWTNKNGTASDDAWGGSSMEAGAASVNMSWTTGGAGAGEWAGIAISLKPVSNSAPLLDNSGTMAMTTISEDQTTNTGNTVAEIIASAGGNRITDPDAGAVEGIAVTTLISGNGNWQFSTNGGSGWTAAGVVYDNAALLLRGADLIRFVPDANNADSPGFSFRAWDQTSGTAGTRADVSVNGGTTAFSAATGSVSVMVTAVNDAPSLSVSSSFSAINEDDYNNSGNLVSQFAGYAVDVDAGALKGLAISAVDNSNGTWQYTLNGTTWLPIGNVSISAARLLPSNETARIRFVPNANWYGNTGLFYYLAWDQTTGAPGELADVTVRGGTTAFSSGISGTTHTVNSVNDAPVITSNGGGTTASISVQENSNAVTTVVATDIDVPVQTLTYSISGGTDAAKFMINSSTGALSFISAPDFENPADADLNNIYAVTVRVSDGNLTDTQALSVTVTNVSNSLIVTSVSDASDGAVASIEALNVNKGADGVISLREAIIAANNTAGTEEISFNIPGTGPHTINVLSALPLITGTVILDGTTEPDFSGTPIIEINGTGTGSTTDGLVLSSGSSNSIVRGLVINRFGRHGIAIVGLTSTGSLIQGNYIGTDVTGKQNLGNRSAGIFISSGAANNQLGGTQEGAGNTIAFNNGAGIWLNSDAGAANAILGNSIYSNIGIGIDLLNNQVTANDNGDADTGPNDLQNFPVLESVISSEGSTLITGSFNSKAGLNFRIEFFSSPTGDPTGYGEGQNYLGFTTVTTDDSGNADIQTTFTGVTVPEGYSVSAIATVDHGNGSFGNSSEFAANVPVSTVSFDDPCEAALLTVNQNCSFTVFSNYGASGSDLPLTYCDGYAGGNLWFKALVPSSGNMIVKLESDATEHYPNNNGWAHRLGLAVYSGTCTGLIYDTCRIEAEGPGIPVNPEIVLKGYTPGNMLYLRVWEYNNDDNGQFRICVFTDVQNPTISCPTGVTRQTDPGSCTGSVTIPLPVVNDNYGIGSVINDFNGTADASDDYPVGTTTVKWIVTDLAGNSVKCNQSITISDNQYPEITCLPDRAEYLNNNCEFIIPEYINSVTVNDNCDPAPSVSQSPVAGTIISGEGPIQQITIFSTDRNGNTGSCTFNVVLHDNILPVITCPRDTIITLSEGIYKAEVNLLPPSANDNCGIRSITNDFNSRADASGIYATGTTIITYTATDLNGNSARCSQQITLKTGGDLPFGLVIPQGFSPNNDGLNDIFEILGLEAYPGNELSVLNIWGYELFYMKGYDNSWDGTATKGISSGKKLPTGTYYYILKLGNGQSVKGFVYIIKE